MKGFKCRGGCGCETKSEPINTSRSLNWNIRTTNHKQATWGKLQLINHFLILLPLFLYKSLSSASVREIFWFCTTWLELNFAQIVLTFLICLSLSFNTIYLPLFVSNYVYFRLCNKFHVTFTAVGRVFILEQGVSCWKKYKKQTKPQ